MSYSLNTPSTMRYQHGLSYVEVMIASILLVTSLIPMLESLQSGILGTNIHKSLTTS